jgi:hypothetical protein
MKINRVRVKTAVCAMVLSTTGSVMSTVNATGPHLTPLLLARLSFILFIAPLSSQSLGFWDQSYLVDNRIHGCNMDPFYKGDYVGCVEEGVCFDDSLNLPDRLDDLSRFSRGYEDVCPNLPQVPFFLLAIQRP